MADVEQLLVGYTADDPNPDGRYGASGSVTLIRDGDARILVDVGDPWNGSQVVDKLRLRSLAPNQITHVVITHGHIDHAGNLNLFSEARIIMDSDECVRGAYGTISTEELLSPNVRVCRFRGHTGSDLCVFATTNAHQCIAVAGDLFECEEDDDLWRNTSQFPDEQLDSRQRILDLADFIIPGHGPIFPVSDAKDAEPTLPDDIE